LTLRVGLTGGIACGKSRVRRRLAAAGFSTLDLDRIAHEVMAPGAAAHREVVEAFGTGVLAADGSVDRRRLGERVFADAAARARLNAIVHPRVREEEARRVAALPDREGRVVVTDAALLVEAGVHLRFDRLVVVHCLPDQQVRRLVERDGLDEAAARARVDAQMPVLEKRRFAHLEVDASASPEQTDRAADAVAAELRALAARSGAPRVAVPLERRAGLIVAGPSTGPRGLEPAILLADIAAAGGLEMERIARRLVPPTARPWYRAAGPETDGPGPEALAGPVVLWSLARGGPDPDFLAAAAASLARLTHTEPVRIAGACLFALVLQDTLVAEAIGSERPRAVLSRWVDLARRWGGAPPPAHLADAAMGLADAAAAAPASTAPRSVIEALQALG
jgi:dephospho-CoA kinase